LEVNIRKLDKKGLLYDGSTKKIFATDNPDYLFMEFKNDLRISERKTLKIRGKAQINNEIAAYVFQFLDSYHIPNHFVGKLDDKTIVVRKMDMVPVEVVIRNIAADHFARSYRLDEGLILPAPIIEFYFKNEKMGNPMVNEYHLYAFGSANQEEVRTIQRLSAKVNAIMRNFFERRNFKLVDFKLEFGRFKDKIYLGDEITLDTVRIWEIGTDRKLEKEIAHGKEAEINRIYAEIKQKFTHPRTKDEKINAMAD